MWKEVLFLISFRSQIFDAFLQFFFWFSHFGVFQSNFLYIFILWSASSAFILCYCHVYKWENSYILVKSSNRTLFHSKINTNQERYNVIYLNIGFEWHKLYFQRKSLDSVLKSFDCDRFSWEYQNIIFWNVRNAKVCFINVTLFWICLQPKKFTKLTWFDITIRAQMFRKVVKLILTGGKNEKIIDHCRCMGLLCLNLEQITGFTPCQWFPH